MQKRVVRSTGTTQSKKVDLVREKIARRAALEFKNGMYGN